MDSCLKIESASLSSATGEPFDAPARDREFASLAQTATLEFLSSLQLLAERAKFVTGAHGVAIALKEGEQFVYSASAGAPVAESATSVDMGNGFMAECIANRRVSFASGENVDRPLAQAAVPVIRQQTVTGFFQLAANRPSFSEEDIFAVSRLAEMVNTALDHMEAAENAANRIFVDPKPQSAAGTAVPVLWHAPTLTLSKATPETPHSSAHAAANIRACQSCGFPVSEGRTLCVECEQNPDPAPALDAPLFAIEKQESWISAHGYTIASLLITALAAAIILWLR